MEKILTLGKIDYNNSGRKNCLVTYEVEIEARQKETRDVNLNKLTSYKVFTMSADVWNPIETYIYRGGQCCDDIANEFFPKNKHLHELVEIWKVWHLNDLNAGTTEQSEAVKKWRNENNVTAYAYDQECEFLKSINLYEDNGYKYGHDWLVNPLPESVEQRVYELIELIENESK